MSPTGPQQRLTRARWTISGKVVRMKKHTSPSRQADQEGVPARPPDGFLAQGVNYAKRFTRDRLTKPEATPVSEIEPGQAKVIGVDGDKVGVYRDAEGALHAVSAVCTHRGCVVDWNAVELSWDCPCHGSRFDCDGHVLQGPAQRELEVKRVEAAIGSR
jgi:Rieske Fe-S protein